MATTLGEKLVFDVEARNVGTYVLIDGGGDSNWAWMR